MFENPLHFRVDSLLLEFESPQLFGFMKFAAKCLWVILMLSNPCNAQDQAKTGTNVERAVTGDTFFEIGPNIRCIFQDSKKNIWFATNGQGVFKYDGKSVRQFTDKHGICCNFVWNVQEANNGDIWFKTEKGICYYNGKQFTVQQEAEMSSRPIDHNFMKDLLLIEHYYDGRSLVKIALPHSSYLKDENENSRFQYDIYSTLKDRHGHIWFGTCTAGVCKYDGKEYTWIDNKELGAPVRSIFEDKKGTIWIGNNGYGLFRYDGERLVNVTKQQKLENPNFIKNFESKEGTLARVWTIAEDKKGNLWIGTIDAGVWMFDGKSFTNYTTKDGLGTDLIWTIYKDKDDILWFGTDGAGVYQFDGKKFSKFML